MRKYKRLGLGSKKVVSVVTAACLVGTLAGCVRKNDLSNENVEQNRIGYSSVSSDVKEENFVILDAGNHDAQSKKVKKQIRKCNDNDISVGIIISTEAKSEADIYDDVEYVRSLVNEYKIDFPVYLDLEQIINNGELNNDMKSKLMSDFLEKCSANNMYVGIAGSEKTLSLAKEYFKDVIKDYDAYVTKLSEDDIDYSGQYTLYKGQDGKIYSTCDLSSVIKEEKLNLSEGLKNDFKTTISSFDDLNKVSFEYGISVEDLLAYNEIKADDITGGLSLKIPSKISDQTEKTKLVEIGKKMVRGCDISWAQKDNIDWKQIKENFEFVIIRSNRGQKMDDYFQENIEKASSYGIKTGVFCFNNYTTFSTTNLEEFKNCQKAQVDLTLKSIKDYEMTYPVYLDIERKSEEGSKSWNELLPDEYAISMINIWCESVLNNGYIPGLYFNQSTCDYFQSLYKKINSKTTRTDEENDFLNCWNSSQLWIAGGKQYGSKHYHLSEVERPSDKIMEKYPDATGFQVTSTAIGAGAGNDAGCLDVNWFYEFVTKGEGINEPIEIKTFNDDATLALVAEIMTIGTVGTGIGFYYAYKKYKEKKENEKKREKLQMIKRKTKYK